MFPLKNTEAYIHANGYRSTLGKELAARDADISEVKSEIQALTNYDANTGVKNLLPNNATSTTINDVTFTVNADGSITVNGTASAEAKFEIYADNSNSCPYNGYILSGCPSGGSDSKYDLRISDVTAGSIKDFGNGVTINVSDTGQWNVTIVIRNGQTVSNLTFYPMIRLASITDPTYQPYAKTNVELTADVNDLNKVTTGTLTLSSDYFDTTDTSNNYGTWERNGKVVTFFMQGVTKVEVPSGNTNLAQGLPLRVGAPIVGFAYDITNGAANPSLLGQVRITAGTSSIINYPFNNAIATGKKIRIFGTYICD